MEPVYISNSLRNSATACQKSFWFSYFEGLVPKTIPAYFSTGILWHKIMEGLFVVKDLASPDKRMERAFIELAALKQIALDAESDSEEVAKVTTMYELIAGMLKTYQDTLWSVESQWEVLAVEEPFRISLSPKLKLLDEDSPRMKNEFVGIIDLIIRDSNGYVWPIERKTTMTTSPDIFQSELRYDYQPVGYVIATQLLAEKRWPNSPVVGIDYRVARKMTPKKPSANQCSNCKGEGIKVVKVPIAGTKTFGERREICSLCDGSGRGKLSLKNLENTSRKAFEEAEMENPQIHKIEYGEWFTGEYLPYKEKMLAKVRPFHWNFQHVITSDIVSAWVRDTICVAQNIRRMGRMKPEQFVRSLNKFGSCPTCQFKDLCFDDSPDLREVFFNKCNIRAALPRELQARQKEEEQKESVNSELEEVSSLFGW